MVFKEEAIVLHAQLDDSLLREKASYASFLELSYYNHQSKVQRINNIDFDLHLVIDEYLQGLFNQSNTQIDSLFFQ